MVDNPTQPNQIAYGLNQPGYGVVQEPITSLRAPTTNDRFAIGTIWCDTVLNDVYICSGYTLGLPQWIGAGGGSGVFSSLTVTPGPINFTGTFTQLGTTFINATGTANTSIGNATGTLALLGPITHTGTFGQTGNMTATGILTVTGTETISGTAGATSLAVTGLTTGVPIVASSSGVTVPDYSAAVGGYKTVAPSVADTVPDTVTNNARSGRATFANFSCAAAATETLTLLNSTITDANTVVLYSWSGTTPDSVLSIQSAVVSAGQIVFTFYNNTAATTDIANKVINFWVMN